MGQRILNRVETWTVDADAVNNVHLLPNLLISELVPAILFQGIWNSRLRSRWDTCAIISRI